MKDIFLLKKKSIQLAIQKMLIYSISKVIADVLESLAR